MTIDQARLDQVSVLTRGSHDSPDEGLSVMEAVAFVAGEPHGATPACACPVIGAFLRAWNDDLPTDAARVRLLMPLIPRLVGSRSTPAVEQRRARLAYDWWIRTSTPMVMDFTDALKPHAARLRALAPLLSDAAMDAAQPTLEAASLAAQNAARDARDARAAWAAWAAWDARDARDARAAWAAWAAWDARDAWAAWAAWDAWPAWAAWAAWDAWAAWAAWDARDAVETLAAHKKVAVVDLSYAEVYDAVSAACTALFAPVRDTLDRSALDLIDAMLAVTPETLASEAQA